MKNRSAETPAKPIKVFMHWHPDTDAWLCFWLLTNHQPEGSEVKLGFVKAGTRLPEDDPDWEQFEVIHVDTGGGKFDQHGKELKHSSSFELVANELGYRGDAAIEQFIVMANNADNARTMDPTSIHYLISALPSVCKASERQYEREVDWALVLDRVFFIFDTMASKWRVEAEVAAKFDRLETIQTLPNGLTFCALSTPGSRHAAYERGVDVVAWISPTKGGKADLTSLIALLRREEASCRGIDITGLDLEQFSQVEGIPGWFLHDSLRFLGSGTKSHPLEGSDLTQIKAKVFFGLVRDALSEIEFEERT